MSEGMTIKEQLSNMGNLITAMEAMQEAGDGFSPKEQTAMARKVSEAGITLASCLLMTTALSAYIMGGDGAAEEFFVGMLKNCREEFAIHVKQYEEELKPLRALQSLHEKLSEFVAEAKGD